MANSLIGPRVWVRRLDRLPALNAPVWILLDRQYTYREVFAGMLSGRKTWVKMDELGAGWAIECVSHWMPRLVDEAPLPPTDAA